MGQDFEDMLADQDQLPGEPTAAGEWHGQQLTQTLKRLLDSWENRAAVKKPGLHLGSLYHDGKPDFLVPLLPFADHPMFEKADEELRQAALSCGWLAYSEKTIAIESKIVNPACMHVIDGDIPSIRSEVYRETASQALVDESYHILMIVKACQLTRRLRGLNDLIIPQFELVRKLQVCLDQHPERWQKVLIQLAFAIVSEVMVSDYLKLLSDADSIQPINRMTTEIHRRDESAHSAVFKTIGAAILHRLTKREQEFFLKILPQPAQWFADAELYVWRSMLTQIGFPQADRMIDDCVDEQQAGVELDLSKLDELYVDLEVNRTFRC